MIQYAQSGESFYSAVSRIQSEMLHREDYIDLIFNDISVRVSKNSNPHDIATIYDLKCELRRLKLLVM